MRWLGALIVTALLLTQAGESPAKSSLQIQVRESSNAKLISAEIWIWSLEGTLVKLTFAPEGRLDLADMPVGTFDLEACSRQKHLVGTTRVVVANNAVARALIAVHPEPPPLRVVPEKVNQLIRAAAEAYIKSKHKRAASLCKQALKLSPGHYKTIQILGASSCYVKNRVDAQWACDRVSESHRLLLKKVCLNNGVKLR